MIKAIYKLSILFLILFSFVSCSNLDSIPYSPEQTPESWLASQPSVNVNIAGFCFVWMQPGSTIIVYSLGILTFLFGLYFLRNQKHQKARMWWGIALVLWGIGALLAGTSYQAFSYEIKCAGCKICKWTSWFEVFYLLFSAVSIDSMMMAMSHSSAGAKLKKILQKYAVSKSIIYTILLIIGAIIPVKFLISFELLLLVSAPSIVVFLIINISNFKKYGQKQDKLLIGTWLGLGLIIAIYFLYLMFGFTEKLYNQGYWFSANDVLHNGLIIWMLYIRFTLVPKLNDSNVVN